MYNIILHTTLSGLKTKIIIIHVFKYEESLNNYLNYNSKFKSYCKKM